MKIPWLVLQLADSAFPSGGFAHSYGLESWAAHHPGASLEPFVRHTLWQTGASALPFVTAAHRAPDRWAELDAFVETILISPLLNRASRTQGRAFFDTCSRIFPLEAPEKGASLAFHHAPTFGVVFRRLGVEESITQQMVLHQTARGILSAATRLGLIGTHQSQALLSALSPVVDEIITGCAQMTENDAVQTSPITDLFASMHDKLYSRLFLS